MHQHLLEVAGYSLTVQWLEETDLPVAIGTHRRDLKEHLHLTYGLVRPRICLACEKPFMAFDMHEGIVSRNDVRGWPQRSRVLIFTEVNCIPLHHACNIDSPPRRELAWQMQADFYGGEILRAWYEGLPWKAGVPRRFW